MKSAIGVVTVNLRGNASCSLFRVQRVLQTHIGTISLSHDLTSSISDSEGKYSSSFPSAQQYSLSEQREQQCGQGNGIKFFYQNQGGDILGHPQ